MLNEYKTMINVEQLEQVLKAYKVGAKVIGYHRGPRVDIYEVNLDLGVPINRLLRSAKDIARNLSKENINIGENKEGRSSIEIEIPREREDWDLCNLEALLTENPSDTRYDRFKFPIGSTILGDMVYGTLLDVPHLLVSGATGSGKSHFLKSLIASLVYNCSPDDLRIVLIDFKMIELTTFLKLPHLLTSPITDLDTAISALRLIADEMERRFKAMSTEKAQDPSLQYSRWLVIIDEYADLILSCPEVEKTIIRIAQKGRSAGIHIVISTQRPSRDVMTGLLKSNFLDKIALKVNTLTDSRISIDIGGAEKLMGYGDLLYKRRYGCVIRAHAPSFTGEAYDKCLAKIWSNISEGGLQKLHLGTSVSSEKEDPILPRVLAIVLSKGSISISQVQRACRVGYIRSAALINLLIKKGILDRGSGGKGHTLNNRFKADSICLDEILLEARAPTRE